jgi:hypothetical protein
MKHQLKTWPKHFHEVKARRKQFELRKNDRDFHEGDILELLEYDPDRKVYTGDRISVWVKYIFYESKFGLKKGYVIMSIEMFEQ